MKNDLLGNDGVMELLFGIVTIAAVVIMATGLLFMAIVPMNNYHRANGFVEFKRQYKVITQREGSVTRLLTDNDAAVEQGAPLLQFSSESSEREINALTVRLHYLHKEYATLKKLFLSGAINRPEVDIKNLEIQEAETKLQDYQRDIIYAPVAGRVYYTVVPEHMLGSYLEKGEIVGYIFSSADKHICISFPNTYADRFKIGAIVLFKYSDPVSFKVKKMKGFIYKTFVNKANNTIELYCDLADAAQLDLFRPFTKIDAAITINSTSVVNDMFGVDPFPALRDFFQRFAWCRQIVRFIRNEPRGPVPAAALKEIRSR